MPNAYASMIDRRAGLIREAKEIIATAEDGGRKLLATERERLDAIQHAVSVLNVEIADEEARREARLNAAPAHGLVRVSGDGTRRTALPVPGPFGGRAYAELFPVNAGDPGNFDSAADVWRAVMRRDFAKFEAVTFGPAQGAGYLVPPQYASEVFDSAMQVEIVRPRATVYPMQTNELSIAGFAHEDGSGGARFGIKHNFVDIGSQATPQAPTVRAVNLYARKSMALVAVPNEIVVDSVNFPRQMTDILSRGLGWTFDKEFLTGSGAGQPTGVLNAACTIVATKEAGQASGTLSGANLATMLGRLEPEAFSNPSTAWVGSPSVLQALLQATLVSGATEPLLRQGTTPGSFSLLGLPFLVSEHLPALGTKGDILLADFSDYAIGLRQDYAIENSPHLYFDSDITAWRSIARIDGQPLWDKAYTPSGNGGETVSPFVVLETR